MKKIFLVVFAISIVGCSLQQKLKKYEIAYNDRDFQKDSNLVNSFKSVDSIVSRSKSGKLFYGRAWALKEIYQKTGIPATGGGSFIGAKFTVDDWINWHNWFIAIFRNK